MYSLCSFDKSKQWRPIITNCDFYMRHGGSLVRDNIYVRKSNSKCVPESNFTASFEC